MLEKEARRCSFVLVGNIPGALRSSDLRAFFSHLVEKRGFVCFHFRHRPEHFTVAAAAAVSRRSPGLRKSDKVASEATQRHEEDVEQIQSLSSESSATTGGECGQTLAAGTRCCVAALDKRLEGEFLKRYRGKHWARPGGELLKRKVKISRLSISYQEAGTPSEIGNSMSVISMVPVLVMELWYVAVEFHNACNFAISSQQ